MPFKILVLLSLLAAPPVKAASQEEGADFDGWYQIDLILFKPRNTDLDDESWPEYTPGYPASVISVYPGDAFKLSQVEQALDAGSEPPAPEPVPGIGEFVFEKFSNRERNRRIVEAATGAGGTNSRGAGYRPDPGSGDLPPDTGSGDIPAGETAIDPATGQVAAASADPDLIRELIRGGPNTSQGQLAFADTTAASSLATIGRSLRRSSLFDVIDHLSWVQPVNTEPTHVLMQAGKRYGDRFEVEGSLSFSRSRYLHVRTDLWYSVFEPRVGGSLREPESGPTDEQLEAWQALVQVERERGSHQVAASHVMKQSRRLRSSELHYLDHPLFGVIVRINRYRP